MEDTPPPPLLLANRVIKQMVEHMLADAPTLAAKDYMLIRTVFRSAGGAWADLTYGDTGQLARLQQVITAWSKMQPPKTQSEII